MINGIGAVYYTKGLFFWGRETDSVLHEHLPYMFLMQIAHFIIYSQNYLNFQMCHLRQGISLLLLLMLLLLLLLLLVLLLLLFYTEK